MNKVIIANDTWNILSDKTKEELLRLHYAKGYAVSSIAEETAIMLVPTHSNKHFKKIIELLQDFIDLEITNAEVIELREIKKSLKALTKVCQGDSNV